MPSWTPEARRFLEAHRVGHLATATAGGAPHVVPVCYAIDDQTLYFVADAKPKRRPARELARLQNLRANPRAAVVVDDWAEDWTRLAFVLVRGPAREITDPLAHAAALRLLRARYPQYVGMSLDDVIEHPVVGIEPASVVLWRATPPD
jgi:PPOX class probable F420-dependent enzyme